MDKLEGLRAALHRDPRGTAERAAALAADARAAGDDAALSRSLAVLGRARRSLGEIALAESDLRSAVAVADTIPDPELAADALVGLAGVLSFAGRASEGVEHLDRAEALGSEKVRAYVSLQRAIVQQRTGQLTAARASYDAALPVLRSLDAPVDLALVLMNRGVIRTQTGEIAGAIADMAESAALFTAEGHAFGIAQTRHGLGWAEARGGDLPRALAHLEEAIEHFERLGHAALEVQVDRVEVLLAAGLSSEALRLGAETADRLAAAGNRSQAAETWLLCAQAARVEGDTALAVEHAGRARQLFQEQEASGWERAAHLEALRSTDPAGHVGELRTLAADLDAAGNATGAATAVALAGVGAATGSEPEDVAIALAAESRERARRLGVLEVRLLADAASASVARAVGDRTGARRHLRRGLDDLQRHRVELGASDARAAVASHAARLTALGLAMAAEEGRAATVFEWTERALAGRRRHPPARPPDDAALAAALAELRAVVAEVRSAQLEERDPTDLLARQRQLEQRIHRSQLNVAGSAAAGVRRWAPPAIADVRAALGDRALVTVAEVGDRLVGVAIGPGRTRWAELGPAADAEKAAGAIASSLRNLATGRAGRIELVERALGALARAMGPVVDSGAVRDASELVLVVPPALQTVPWQQAPFAAGRALVVAPSAAWWTDAGAPSPAAGPVLAVAGPRLAEAEQEAHEVARCHTASVVLTGAAAMVDAVSAGLAEASVAHVAAHGRVRQDNPLWSALDLADGPLCVYDIERLERTPATVVLSACDSGAGRRAGDGLLGIATSLLNLGTRSLVATVCPLPDTPATRTAMVALHHSLAAGRSPAQAVAALDADPLTRHCLTTFGA